jgi:hypothetical protein
MTYVTSTMCPDQRGPPLFGDSLTYKWPVRDSEHATHLETLHQILTALDAEPLVGYELHTDEDSRKGMRTGAGRRLGTLSRADAIAVVPELNNRCP